VALVRAYGLRDVEAGLKVTTDTQFLIGSITKSITSIGLALLVDERLLDWKKPVREYIPEFRLHDAMRYLEPSDDIRSTFQYLNLGYLVASIVIERVCGQSWTEFTRA
jgi:CubicO group peptidase (beta-lactamase class C family)